MVDPTKFDLPTIITYDGRDLRFINTKSLLYFSSKDPPIIFVVMHYRKLALLIILAIS